ncbi:MAG: tetratricopeptide repeat protein, partial [Desulfomonilaceae bacterium]
GKYNEAAGDYAQAINLDPKATDVPILYYSLGESLLLGRQLDYAIRAFTKAIQLNPQNGLAYANRGVAFKDKGDLMAAVSDFTVSLNLLKKQSSKEYVSQLLKETDNQLKTQEPQGVINKIFSKFPGPKSAKQWPQNLW